MLRTLCPVAAVAAVALFAASSSAEAGVPAHPIDAPKVIALVGSMSGVPAPLGRFEVRVRDLANNPMSNVAVVVDLSQCEDLHLCANPWDSTIVVDCVARTAVARTDILGVARFTLLGGSRGYSHGGPSTIGARGRIVVPPYLGYEVDVSVTAYDLDGVAGVGANDLGHWLTDFGSGVPWARSDYDGGGSVGANDMSLWLEAFGQWYMPESCTASCP